MPRYARMESETKHYHVMTRGINKERIFSTDNDKKKMLQLLKLKLEDVDCKCIAYCIMDNHLHLALIAEIDELRNIMKKINISYAMYYNRKHNRIGPVFQDRFKSENIMDESHLIGVIRYIHNNPVNANAIKSPESYKWSSMREYIIDGSFLIGEKIKDNILREFDSNDAFIEFHRKEDDTKFLEVREEEKKNLEKRVGKIIESYYQEKGIVESSQSVDLEELIIRLTDKGLPYRKVAELTNTSLNKVYMANKKNRP